MPELAPSSLPRGWNAYLAGHAVSALGDRVTAVALPLLATGLSAQPSTLLSTVAAAGTGAQLLFLLAGSVWADRLPARRLMIAADLLRALTLTGLILNLSRVGAQPWLLPLCAALLGVGGAAFLPASARLMITLVPGSQITEANARKGTAQNLSGLIGPPLAGALVGAGHAALALGTDALSFLLSLLGVRAESPGVAPVAGERLNWARAIPEPWLRAGIGLFAVLNIFAVNFTLVLVPLLAHGGARLGLLYTAETLGALGCAALMIRTPGVQGARAMFLGVALAGGAAALCASGVFALQLAALALFGTGVMAAQVCWNSALQRFIPAGRLGRAASADLLGSLALLAPGLLLLSRLNLHLGVNVSLLLCGAAITLLAVAGLNLRAFRAWTPPAAA